MSWPLALVVGVAVICGTALLLMVMFLILAIMDGKS